MYPLYNLAQIMSDILNLWIVGPCLKSYVNFIDIYMISKCYNWFTAARNMEYVFECCKVC